MWTRSPQYSARTGAADAVIINLGKLAFDGVPIPKPALVQNRRSRGAEAVTANFFLRVAKTTPRAIDGVFAHAAVAGSDGGKEEYSAIIQFLQFPEIGNGLRWQIDQMIDTLGLGFGRRNDPK
jgi:hypothetical protein